MAIYSLNAEIVSRGKGDSSIGAAAYQSRSRMIDARTGEVHDYSRNRDELLFEGIYAPKGAPEWARDRESLWNHVEQFEKRKDAQLARRFIIALPYELTTEQNRYAIQDWVRENFTRKGYIADVAIHEPGKEGDNRNYHAHVLVVMRKLDGQELAAKKERLNVTERKDELQAIRESWERIGNRHLERHGFEPSLDHRTLEAQGIERVPSVHLGRQATALERDGIQTERGDLNREIVAENERRVIELAAERVTPQHRSAQEAVQQREPPAASETRAGHQRPSQAPENRSSIEQEREAQREAWIAARKAEREQRRQPNWIEQRIADQDQQARLYSAPITVDRDGQRVTGADALADRMKPEGEREFRSARARSYAEAFSARLDDAGIALVRVTAKDVQTLSELREAAEQEGPTRRTATGSLRHTSFGDVKEGDLAAVTKSGELYRINPEKLGQAVLPENLPSVIAARMAFQVDRERTNDLYQHRKDEQTVAREAAAEAREKRAAQINQWKERGSENVASKGFGFGGKVLGAVVGGAIRFLDGFFSSTKKPTAQEVHDRAQAAGNVETQHSKAYERALEEGDLRLARTLDEISRAETDRQAAPEYFRPITRPVNRDRDRDDGHERERERDRGYER
jgi:hypothetical protein